MDKIASELASEYSDTFYEDGVWQLKAANILVPSNAPSTVACRQILHDATTFISSDTRRYYRMMLFALIFGLF